MLVLNRSLICHQFFSMLSSLIPNQKCKPSSYVLTGFHVLLYNLEISSNGKLSHSTNVLLQIRIVVILKSKLNLIHNLPQTSEVTLKLNPNMVHKLLAPGQVLVRKLHVNSTKINTGIT